MREHLINSNSEAGNIILNRISQIHEASSHTSVRPLLLILYHPLVFQQDNPGVLRTI